MVSTIRLATAGLLTAAVALPALGQDVVGIRTDENGQTLRRTGLVVDYTGVELRLRSPSGQDTTVPADRVAYVQTERGEAQLSADRLRREGRYEEALAAYRQAMADESRPWVQREIYAGSVWCYLARRQHDAAGTLFLELLKSDPATLHFGCVPLAWLPPQPDPSFEPRAASWLADPNSVAVLLGASHLLGSRRQGEAVEALKRLTTDRDPRVALLAEAQLWRTSLTGFSEEEMQRRRQVVERMPAALRAGPYHLIGQMSAHRGEHEQAALSFLRAPIQYRDHRPLAAAGLLAAATSLERLERHEQAQGLYRELVTDHGNTPEAKAARSRLESG